MSDQHDAATVCLSVRVTPERAELLRAYASTHRVTVQAVLDQCVTSAIDCLRAEAGKALDHAG